jgi:hypothetical protein
VSDFCFLICPVALLNSLPNVTGGEEGYCGTYVMASLLLASIMYFL